MSLFADQYRNKTVLLTGHTGFKGSWLAYWLHQLGANVVGDPLPAPTEPSHWALLDLPVRSTIGTITDLAQTQCVFSETKPDIVFRLPRRPSSGLRTATSGDHRDQYPRHGKRTGVRSPNAVGTGGGNCYERTVLRKSGRWPTTDRNRRDGRIRPVQHVERRGRTGYGELPKLVFQSGADGHSHQTLVASVRAGNVIGGGDWAADRLIPDLIRGSVSGQPVSVRYPDAVRPWQHVLEPLAGYLLVGQHLLTGNVSAATGWNFGPEVDDTMSVRAVIDRAKSRWDAVAIDEQPSASNPHEAHLLRLDCTKAHRQLSWQPVWNTGTAIDRTIDWYQTYYEKNQLYSDADLTAYVQQARAANLIWTR